MDKDFITPFFTRASHLTALLIMCASSLTACKDEVSKAHNIKQPTPPTPEPVPDDVPPPPNSRHVDIFPCKGDAFSVEGEVKGEVSIEHSGEVLVVEDLVHDDSVSFHVRIHAPGTTRISVRGSTSVRILRACGDRLTVESAGSSEVELDGELGTLEFDTAGSTQVEVTRIVARRIIIDTAGSSSLSARGTTETLEIDTAGSSEISAFALRAQDVRVDAAGSTEVEVCVTGDLSINASGSCEIVHDCSPTRVTQEISGSGSVRPR